MRQITSAQVSEGGGYTQHTDEDWAELADKLLGRSDPDVSSALKQVYAFYLLPVECGMAAAAAAATGSLRRGVTPSHALEWLQRQVTWGLQLVCVDQLKMCTRCPLCKFRTFE
jgi:hypothetical protein